MRTPAGTVLRVAGFVVVSSLVAVSVWRLLSGPSFGPSEEYSAVFTDISGLQEHSEVRIAGVAVGRVVATDLDDENRAVVRFSVSRTLPLTPTTRAAVRYKDLTGNRYLALSDPSAGTGVLPAGSRIPPARTAPALNLDTLFGSFQPLFQALQPEQVNELSGQLVQVLQGEGGTVLDLLRNVADITATLADRDAVIGTVIRNLTTVLTSVSDHGAEFSAALTQASRLVSGLAEDRKDVVGGLTGTARLVEGTDAVLRTVRPEITATAGQVGRLSALLTTPANGRQLDTALQRMPKAYLRMSGAGSYGTFFNYYLCGVGITDALPIVVLGQSRCR